LARDTTYQDRQCGLLSFIYLSDPGDRVKGGDCICEGKDETMVMVCE